MRRLSWAYSLVILAVAMSTIGVSAPSGRVDAQSEGNGLDETSINTFLLDAERGVVQATIEVTLTNVTRDRTEGDVINRTFFDGYYVAVPLGAENIVATRDGEVLDGDLSSDPEFPAFSFYEFPLNRQLFSGESTTVTVTYDHFGAEPRNDVPWRVNAAYAAFVAFGIGDDEQVTIRVVQPVGYEFDEFTDLRDFEVSEPDPFGLVTYTRSGLDEEYQLIVGMSNDDKLLTTALDVEGVDIELRSWPDDPDWTAFATDRVERGIPALEDLIGTDWPVDGDFDIRQTVEPYLAGYAGWFDEQSKEIAVGEELDADTIYHELSHAWFNGSLSDERWLTEGLAQVYAAELVRVDGDEPREPTEPSPTDSGFRKLTGWSALGSADSVEEFGYNASFWVLDALVDEIGLTETAVVLAAFRDGTSPYAPDLEGDAPSEDWQHVYDLFVEVGGAGTTRELFETHVISLADTALIAARDDAAAEVVALAERSTPWELPAGIRNTLERWDTDDTAKGIEGADAVLALRSELESARASTGVDEPQHGEDAFESAVRKSDGSVDFTAAVQPLESAVARGVLLNDLLELIAERAPAAGVTPPTIAGVDGVDDFESGIAAADDQLDAIERVVATADRVAAISGTTAAIGRWGTNLDAEVDAARSEIDHGDTEAARDLLDSTDERIDQLDDVGARRLLIAGLAALALVLLVVVMIVLRRRRRSAR